MDEEYLPRHNNRWFGFFADGSAATMAENLDIEVPFEIADIRLHLSVSHASAVYFRAVLSSVKGSAHNLVFVSQIMNTQTDYVWRPSTPMRFVYGDDILLQMSLSSANVWGISVTGWTVVE